MPELVGSPQPYSEIPVGTVSEMPETAAARGIPGAIERSYGTLARGEEQLGQGAEALATPLAEAQAASDAQNQKVMLGPDGKIQVQNQARSLIFGRAGEAYAQTVAQSTAAQVGNVVDQQLTNIHAQFYNDPDGQAKATQTFLAGLKGVTGNPVIDNAISIRASEKANAHLDSNIMSAANLQRQRNYTDDSQIVSDREETLLALAQGGVGPGNKAYDQALAERQAALDRLQTTPYGRTTPEVAAHKERQFQLAMQAEATLGGFHDLIQNHGGIPAAKQAFDKIRDDPEMDVGTKRRILGQAEAIINSEQGAWEAQRQQSQAAAKDAIKAIYSHDPRYSPSSPALRILYDQAIRIGDVDSIRAIDGAFVATQNMKPGEALPDDVRRKIYDLPGKDGSPPPSKQAPAPTPTAPAATPAAAAGPREGQMSPAGGPYVRANGQLYETDKDGKIGDKPVTVAAPAAAELGQGPGHWERLNDEAHSLRWVPDQPAAQPAAATAGETPKAEPAVATAPAPATEAATLSAPGGLATYKRRVAQIESSGGRASSNIYQFQPGTIAKTGWTPDRAGQEAAMDRLTAENRSALQNGLGRDPTPAELYLAHQQGAQGALRLIAEPSRRAADIVGEKAITGNGGSANMTAGEFVRLWDAKYNGTKPGPIVDGGAPSANGVPFTPEQVRQNPYLLSEWIHAQVQDPEEKIGTLNSIVEGFGKISQFADTLPMQEVAAVKQFYDAHPDDPRAQKLWGETAGIMAAMQTPGGGPSQAQFKADVEKMARDNPDIVHGWMAAAYKEHETQREKDKAEEPYTFAANRKIIAPIPAIDPAHPEALGSILAKRAEDGRTIGSAYGETPPPILQKSDAPIVGGILRGSLGAPALITVAQAMKPEDLLRLADEKEFVSAVDGMRNSGDYGKAAAAFAVMDKMAQQNSGEFELKFHDGLKDLAWWQSIGQNLSPDQYLKKSAERHDPGYEAKMAPFDEAAKQFLSSNHVDTNYVVSRNKSWFGGEGAPAPGGVPSDANAQLLYDWSNWFRDGMRDGLDPNAAQGYADKQIAAKWTPSQANGGRFTAYAPEQWVKNPKDGSLAFEGAPTGTADQITDKELKAALGLPDGLRRGQTNVNDLFGGGQNVTIDVQDRINQFYGPRILQGDNQTKADLSIGKPPSYAVFLQDKSGRWFTPTDNNGQALRIRFTPDEINQIKKDSALGPNAATVAPPAASALPGGRSVPASVGAF